MLNVRENNIVQFKVEEVQNHPDCTENKTEASRVKGTCPVPHNYLMVELDFWWLESSLKSI